MQHVTHSTPFEILQNIQTTRPAITDPYQTRLARTRQTQRRIFPTPPIRLDELATDQLAGYDREMLEAMHLLNPRDVSVINSNHGPANPSEWPHEEIILTDPNSIIAIKNKSISQRWRNFPSLMDEPVSPMTRITVVDRIVGYCLNPHIKPKKSTSKTRNKQNKPKTNRAHDFKRILNLTDNYHDILELSNFILDRIGDPAIKDLYMYSLRVSDFQYSITYIFPINIKDSINKTNKKEIYLMASFGLGYKDVSRDLNNQLFVTTQDDWALKTLIIMTELNENKKKWLNARKPFI